MYVIVKIRNLPSLNIPISSSTHPATKVKRVTHSIGRPWVKENVRRHIKLVGPMETWKNILIQCIWYQNFYLYMNIFPLYWWLRYQWRFFHTRNSFCTSKECLVVDKNSVFFVNSLNSLMLCTFYPLFFANLVLACYRFEKNRIIMNSEILSE